MGIIVFLEKQSSRLERLRSFQSFANIQIRMLLKTRSLLLFVVVVTYNYFSKMDSQESYNRVQSNEHLKGDGICQIAFLKHVYQHSLPLAGM